MNNPTPEQIRAGCPQASEDFLRRNGLLQPAVLFSNSPQSPQSLPVYSTPVIEKDGPARTNTRNTGKAFEKELERTCGAYQALRIAVIRKVDPPLRIIWYVDKKTGERRERVIFLDNPWLDMSGCWTARGGRSLQIEAKSTSNHRLAFNGDNGFKSSQWAAMKSWKWAGAATALLWQFNGKVNLWTHEMLVAAEASKAKSLKHEDGLRVEPGVGSLMWDFLPLLGSQSAV